MNKKPLPAACAEWMCRRLLDAQDPTTGEVCQRKQKHLAPWQGLAAFEPKLAKCPELARTLGDWLTAPLASLETLPQQPSPVL